MIKKETEEEEEEAEEEEEEENETEDYQLEVNLIKGELNPKIKFFLFERTLKIIE